ncbi:hypothetical protein [Methylobacterium sp. UNC300MFChir4.1]|uniref:hypothetical protein n=1 Tax=Methylobacterium sp. UNC300MFChir4.1 TaxID=1502747 RepID=UPI0011132F65|nr:hypothetical protein [Methylobacterium sp. UNC300MFChir4.1]
MNMKTDLRYTIGLAIVSVWFCTSLYHTEAKAQNTTATQPQRSPQSTDSRPVEASQVSTPQIKMTIQTPNGPAESVFSPAPADIVSPAEVARPQTESIAPKERFGSGVVLGYPQAEVAGKAKYRAQLASISGWPEFKTEMELQCISVFGKKLCTDIPAFYTRSSNFKLFGELAIPDDINDRVKGVVNGCLLGALGGAITAAVVTSPGSSVPAFKVALISCLSTAAGDMAKRLFSEIEVGLYNTIEPGPWQRR